MADGASAWPALAAASASADGGGFAADALVPAWALEAAVGPVGGGAGVGGAAAEEAPEGGAEAGCPLPADEGGGPPAPGVAITQTQARHVPLAILVGTKRPREDEWRKEEAAKCAARRRLAEIAADVRRLAPEVAAAAAERDATTVAWEEEAAVAPASIGPIHLDADAVRARLEAARTKRAKALLEKNVTGLLRRIQTHRFGPPFNIPVDAERHGLADYHTIITHPMDLGTVQGLLEAGSYDDDPLRFAEDVRLTFKNAVTYNPVGTDVRAMAEALWERFEEGWALIEDKLAAEASERALEDAALERRLALLRREEDAVAADERSTRLWRWSSTGSVRNWRRCWARAAAAAAEEEEAGWLLLSATTMR